LIRHEMRGPVGLIVIDRHERRNALDLDHLDALHQAVGDCLDSEARALVVTGEGTAFCAGADLGHVYGDGFRTALYRALGRIRHTSVPVIAAVNGPAIGAGTQLAIACDLRVASDRAEFGIPTARNGLAVDPWTIRRLALLGGGGLARSMLLGCSTLSIGQADRAGLVNRRGELDDALAWAADIATMAPLSLAYSKRALDVLFEDQEEAADELIRKFDACWASGDFAESHRAREEGREPVFRRG
jgi:enoyl-CoA hydratase